MPLNSPDLNPIEHSWKQFNIGDQAANRKIPLRNLNELSEAFGGGMGPKIKNSVTESFNEEKITKLSFMHKIATHFFDGAACNTWVKIQY